MLAIISNRFKIQLFKVIQKIWLDVFSRLFSDKLFLKINYFINMREVLSLDHPKNYTQKIQWLKLYNTDLLCLQMVDKYESKIIVREKLGDKYIIPLLGVWNSFDEIDFSELPNQFVLKTTHDSGNTIICTDKNMLDFKALSKRFRKALSANYFYKSREYPYKNIKPRIIAEKYMIDNESTELIDYKFFCFHGKVEFIQLSGKIDGCSYVSYYDLNFNKLDIKTNFFENYNFKKPLLLDEMILIAANLAENFIHIRIDLYVVNGQIFFGEYTFHNCGGIIHFEPEIWNSKFGDLIKI